MYDFLDSHDLTEATVVKIVKKTPSLAKICIIRNFYECSNFIFYNDAPKMYEPLDGFYETKNKTLRAFIMRF